MTIRDLKPEIACESLVKKLRTKGIRDERVLDAFRKIPRHRFVDGAMYAQAYDDNALPIGLGQTISQPYVVALMTEMLALKKDEKILEIGTGSGFQAAVLAHFSRRVYTIERHRELGDRARILLRELGYANITFKVGDGTIGWPGHAPFDKIIVTAGAPVVPESLIKQLADGGRLIVPAGDRNSQRLEIYDRQRNQLIKNIETEVAFVPLVGRSGWQQ
ncbi:MAG: protein-L-isoaspartate(D-aspartate) O-methyltransferase [Chitinispirillaceae bacterium]